MPQDSRHPDYQKRIHQWDKCEDAAEGSDAIKSKRTQYLRAPSGLSKHSADHYLPSTEQLKQWQTTGEGVAAGGGDDYETYLQIADWYGAVERTIEGFLGLIFRNPVRVDMPEEWKPRLLPHLRNITHTGIPFDAFCMWMMKEILTTSRSGVLVDMPGTRIPSERRRPHWKGLKARSMINWDTVDIHGMPLISMVMLEEARIERDPVDPYVAVRKPTWHELRLNMVRVGELGGDVVIAPRYSMTEWTKSEGQGSNQHNFVARKAPIVPSRFESPLPFIPFTFINSTHLDTTPPKPDLLPLVEKSLSYYRTSADYEWGLHWTILKTLFLFGCDIGDQKLPLGGTAAINITSGEARADLIEPNGEQADKLRGKLDAAKDEMAILGSRMLSAQQVHRGVEAAETVAWRHAGEHSILQSRVQMCSLGLTRALRHHVWWMGLTDDVDDERINVKLNTDFLPVGLTPQMIQAVSKSMQEGVLTARDVHFLLAQGEALSPEHIHDFETWQTRRELEAQDNLLSGFEVNGALDQRDDPERVAASAN